MGKPGLRIADVQAFKADEERKIRVRKQIKCKQSRSPHDRAVATQNNRAELEFIGAFLYLH